MPVHVPILQHDPGPGLVPPFPPSIGPVCEQVPIFRFCERFVVFMETHPSVYWPIEMGLINEMAMMCLHCVVMRRLLSGVCAIVNKNAMVAKAFDIAGQGAGAACLCR